MKQPKPSVVLQRNFRRLNKLFFNSRLPRNTKCYWNDWILYGDDSMGLSCFERTYPYGPFHSKKEALQVCRYLNSQPKNKKFDYLAFDRPAKNKMFVPMPYICLSSYLKAIPKVAKQVLLHEMIHLSLFIQGKQYGNHERNFDQECRRLLKSREVRNLF